MSVDCCSKCRLYHDFNNVFQYSNTEVCWRCHCHHDKRKKKNNNNNGKKKNGETERSEKEGSMGNSKEGGSDDDADDDDDAKKKEKIDYYNNYRPCDQDKECGNINCQNHKHKHTQKLYKIKKGYQPYVESLKRNQITFQVKLIPCTELMQSFKSRSIFTDQIIENLKSTYRERKDLNHAIVDLMLMYGERYVCLFSRSLKDGGQLELHELLEKEAEKVKEETGWYDEKSDTEEIFPDFYRLKENDEKMAERLLERSGSYAGQRSGRINDSWALLLDLEKKDNDIASLNKILIEKEQRIRELKERLKCRGRQMDEDKKDYEEKIKVQIRHNDSAEKTIKRLEEKLSEYDCKLEDLRERALENIISPSNSVRGLEEGTLQKMRKLKLSTETSEEISGQELIGFRYHYGAIKGKGGSVDGERTLSSCGGDSKYGSVDEAQILGELSVQSSDKLADVVAYLIEGNRKRVVYEKEIMQLKEERRRVLEYVQKHLGVRGQGDEDFYALFNSFVQHNDNKLKSLQEVESKVGSVQGRLNDAMSENMQMKMVKQKTSELLKSTERQAMKLSLEKCFLKGVIQSMKQHAGKNDKRIFPYLHNVTTRPYVEHEF